MTGRRSDANGEVGAAGDSETSTGPPVVLERARTDTWIHAGAVLVAVVLGLGLAWVHWLGLVVGGAFVGLVSPTLTRAIVGAIGFGLVVLVVFALVLGETTWQVLEMASIVYVAVGSALGVPVLGALARGIV